MQQDQYTVTDRADSFLSNPNAGMFAGKRRMGTGPLLDLLADRLAYDSTANVIRVKERNNMLDYIGSSMMPEKSNHILLYVEVDVSESDLIARTFPLAHIYRAKELCHQVPVCFKEHVSDDDYNCKLR